MAYTEEWKHILDNKKNQPLVFIHTPKCAGTYINNILNDLQIINKHHTQALENEGITFTVIRNPIERFESLMNYRLGEEEPRYDWPPHLFYVYYDKSITLNEIVSKMSDSEIVGFKPYNSLIYWSKNIDIFITIDQLQEFLIFFGYFYNPNDYIKLNVSKKERGTFNDETKERIKQLYSNDFLLFTKIVN